MTFEQEKDWWYRRIALKGFEDIEQPDGMLKVWHSRLYTHHFFSAKGFTGAKRRIDDEAAVFQAKCDYWRLAEHMLVDHKFNSSQEKKIWKLHSDGLSIREIVDELNKKKISGFYKNKVHKIINDIERFMGKRFI